MLAPDDHLGPGLAAIALPADQEFGRFVALHAADTHVVERQNKVFFRYEYGLECGVVGQLQLLRSILEAFRPIE